MIEAHRDNPGQPSDWEAVLRRDTARKKLPFSFVPLKARVRYAFAGEVRDFLKSTTFTLPEIPLIAS
jgi:hypothetical protein